MKPQLLIMGLLLLAGSIYDLWPYLRQGFDPIFTVPLPKLLWHAANTRFAVLLIVLGCL